MMQFGKRNEYSTLLFLLVLFIRLPLFIMVLNNDYFFYNRFDVNTYFNYLFQLQKIICQLKPIVGAGNILGDKYRSNRKIYLKDLGLTKIRMTLH